MDFAADRGTEREALHWLESLDWWVGRCSFCTARGVTGLQVAHSLRTCPAGGKSTFKQEMGEAVFQEGFRPHGGCEWCALPREHCARWSRAGDGEWTMDQDVRCQYGSLVYEIVIGLFYSGDSHRVQMVEDFLDDPPAEDDGKLPDGEAMVCWLARRVTLETTEGSQWLRTLHAQTAQARRDVANAHQAGRAY